MKRTYNWYTAWIFNTWHCSFSIPGNYIIFSERKKGFNSYYLYLSLKSFFASVRLHKNFMVALTSLAILVLYESHEKSLSLKKIEQWSNRCALNIFVSEKHEKRIWKRYSWNKHKIEFKFFMNVTKNKIH